MKVRGDIVVYSSDDRLQLVAEVKNKVGATPEWASALRREIMLREAFSNSIYFLLVTPESLFLWKKDVSLETLPDYRADFGDALGQYFRSTDLPITAVSEFSLHIAVTSWLNNIINSVQPVKKGKTVDELLYGSGLFNAIRGGSIATAAMV